MSVVDLTTGELVDVMGREDAERLVRRIGVKIERANVAVGEVIDEIAQALTGKAWVTLGYGSWEAMVEAQGWDLTPKTSVERAALAQLLRGNGMSLRAIGKIVNAGKSTVARDVAAVPNGTPETVVGEDGKSHPSTKPSPDVPDDLPSSGSASGEPHSEGTEDSTVLTGADTPASEPDLPSDPTPEPTPAESLAAEFLRAIAKAYDCIKFDPELLADANNPDVIAEIDEFARGFGIWRQRFTENLPRLQVVQNESH